MELVILLTGGLVLLLLAVCVTYLGITLARARERLEQGWLRLYTEQAAEATELRNRLMAHRWEEFHNLQVATPQATDRAAATLPDFPAPPTRLKDDPEEDEDLQSHLDDLLGEGGLEGDGWRPTVG